MLRVLGRQLSFGNGVTAFAYQVLIDRQVIVLSGGACHSRSFGCRHFPAWFVGEEGAGGSGLWRSIKAGPLSGSVEPGGDPMADQQIHDSREAIVKDNS